MSQHRKHGLQLIHPTMTGEARTSRLRRLEVLNRTPRFQTELYCWRDIFAQNPVPTAILDGPEHNFSQVNDAYLKLVACNRKKLLHRPFRLVFPELVQQGFTTLLHGVYLSGKSFREPALKLKPSGSQWRDSHTFEFTCFPKRDNTGKVLGVVCQFVDVTRQAVRQAQLESRVHGCTIELQKLRHSLRLLNRQVMRVQEEERRRLGIELHDRAGQFLAVLRWKLNALQKSFGKERPDMNKLIDDALQLLGQLAQELRTVSLFLYPPSLEKVGLEAALRDYIAGLQHRGGLSVDLQIGPHLNSLPQALEATVFGVVQESLSNIYRHARTQNASVQITCSKTMLKVEISDKGTGIPGFSSLSDRHFKIGVGIRGMQERVLQLNGKFDITSAVNGTTVRALLPLTGKTGSANVLSCLAAIKPGSNQSCPLPNSGHFKQHVSGSTP